MLAPGQPLTAMGNHARLPDQSFISTIPKIWSAAYMRHRTQASPWEPSRAGGAGSGATFAMGIGWPSSLPGPTKKAISSSKSSKREAENTGGCSDNKPSGELGRATRNAQGDNAKTQGTACRRWVASGPGGASRRPPKPPRWRHARGSPPACAACAPATRTRNR
jgi:hypothetical protein